MKKYLIISAFIFFLAPLSVDASIFNLKLGTSFKFSIGRMFSAFYQAPTISAPAGCTTSYANTGGTGDRRAIITITEGAAAVINSIPLNTIIDGDTTGNGRNFWRNGVVLDGSTSWVLFDFGAGHTPTITESKWYQQDATAEGTWKWQGSNDNSTWTDIGGTFSMVTAATTVQTAMSANTTGYRYYRMMGLSGTLSFNPWIFQMEFKICGY